MLAHPVVTEFGDRAFIGLTRVNEVIRQSFNPVGLVSHKKRDRETRTEKRPHGDTEKTTTGKPRRRASEAVTPADT